MARRPNQRSSRPAIGTSERAGSSDLATKTDFAQHASAVFEQVRMAVLQLIESVPGPVRRAVELQRALEIDQPLAWRVFKIAGVDDPLDAMKYMPSPGAIPRLKEAARRKRLPEHLLVQFNEAIEGYLLLLREHAGSPESLRAMVASLRPNNPRLIDEKCRKIAFQQNTIIWGTQCDLFLGALIVHPTSKAHVYSGVSVAGHIGYHALWPDAVFRHSISVNEDATSQLDVATQPDENILQEFCSPGLDVRAEDDHQTRLKAPGLGRRAAVTYFHTIVAEEMDDPNQLNSVSSSFCVNNPLAMLHLELLIPARTQPAAAIAQVYGRGMDEAKLRERRPRDIIPVDIAVTYMGVFTDAPAAQGIPRYTEMIRSLLERQGWYGTKFDVYRCRLSYPVLHTLVDLRVGPVV